MTTTSGAIFKRMRIAVVALAIVFLSTASSPAEEPSTHAEAAIDDGDPRVEADLLFDSTTAAAGATVRVGVRLRMDSDWHVYWRNSGDSGFPSEVDWSSPDATFGPLQYPAPEVFIDSGGLGTTYGYAGEVLLFSDLFVHENAAGSIRVRAEVRFLVCKVQCIPGQIQLDATLPVGAFTTAGNSQVVASFDRSKGRLPHRPEELGLTVSTRFSVASVQAGERFELSIAVASCEPPSKGCPASVTFAVSPGEIAIDAPESLDLARAATLEHPTIASGSMLVLRGRVLNGHLPPAKFGAVLSVLIDGSLKAVEIVINLPNSADASVAAAAAPSLDVERKSARNEAPISLGPTIWAALGLGLLGGLILNLMPCVLPVLALKAYRIVESGESNPRQLRKEGAAFTVGVLLSMLVLASVVLSLRSAGEAVGWGFQFQAPGFLAFMAALLSIFALNLFGVFEITIAPNSLASVGSSSGATRRSFFDGTLAVLLATPCSAPFLGTAVGFAFAGGSADVVLVFLAIGFGLALPYLAMSWVPGLASSLPRPGAWMEDIRSLLAFALLATVVWLLWIAGRSIGVDGMVWLVGWLLLIGLLTWIFGRLQQRAVERPGRLLAVFSFSILVLVISGIKALPIDQKAAVGMKAGDGIAQWSSVEVHRSVEAGQVVFVDFTADWCLTCKVNERLVLSRPEVAETMRRFNVVHYRADWTLRDVEIFEELQGHGRAGVPLYLVYRGGSLNDPGVLPEILTIDTVVGALRRASVVEARTKTTSASSVLTRLERASAHRPTTP